MVTRRRWTEAPPAEPHAPPDYDREAETLGEGDVAPVRPPPRRAVRGQPSAGRPPRGERVGRVDRVDHAEPADHVEPPIRSDRVEAVERLDRVEPQRQEPTIEPAVSGLMGSRVPTPAFRISGNTPPPEPDQRPADGNIARPPEVPLMGAPIPPPPARPARPEGHVRPDRPMGQSTPERPQGYGRPEHPDRQGQRDDGRGHEFRELLKQPVKELIRISKEHALRLDPKLKKELMTYQVFKAMFESVNRGVLISLGTLEILPDGYGFLRTKTYTIDESDVYVSPSQIKRFGLRTGDVVVGQVRIPKENESYHALLRVEAVNFVDPDIAKSRPHFDELVPLYPTDKLMLETEPDRLSSRVVDLISPIGKGQRGLIVAPPKAGKTTLLKEIANAVTTNHPEMHNFILLIDERPEEVTDMQRSVSAEVASSTFDEPISNHLRVSEMILEKAKRLVEQGEHVMIMMDSLTRLARAYNISVPSSGQTLSGGVNPHALHKPKRFFGAARNVEFGGSLTILATALIETGNKMDDFIFEEFKGTGNMELHLDRDLFNKRIFPSVDIKMSSTRKEELLLADDVMKKIWMLRRAFASASPQEAIELLLKHLKATKNNAEFLGKLGQADLNSD